MKATYLPQQMYPVVPADLADLNVVLLETRMGNQHSSQIFSHPENDIHIMSTWEKFLSGEACGADSVRRLIDDS